MKEGNKEEERGGGARTATGEGIRKIGNYFQFRGDGKRGMMGIDTCRERILLRCIR